MEKMMKNGWFWVSISLLIVNIVIMFSLYYKVTTFVDNAQKELDKPIYSIPHTKNVSIQETELVNLEIKSVSQTNYSLNEDDETGIAEIAIRFDDVVLSKELEDNLIVVEKERNQIISDETKSLPYEILKEDSKNRTIYISINTKRRMQKFSFFFKKGMTNKEESAHLFYAKNIELKLDPKLILRNIYSYRNRYRNEISINLSFNQNIESDKLRKSLLVEPAVDYSITGSYYKYLKGDFKAGKRYKITVLKGLTSDDKVLMNDVTRYITIPNIYPTIKFKSKGIYMSSDSKMNLPYESTNIEKLNFKAYRVYKNNIVHYLNNSYYGGDFSDVVAEKDINPQSELNKNVSATLNLKEFIGKNKNGIYIIKGYGKDVKGRSNRTQQIVMLSDIGISVKKSENSLLVWLNDLQTLKAIPFANVAVYNRKNQIVAEGVSNDKGMIHLKNKDFKGKNVPYAIVVDNGDDLAVLKLSDGFVSKSNFDVYGKNIIPSGYDAFTYSERGVYRPGETVHLQTILRDVNKKIKLAGEFPIEITVKRADGNLFKKETVMLSEFGIANLDLQLPQNTRTGRYFVSVNASGDKNSIGNHSFIVEDFMPDKIKVDVKCEDKRYKKDEKFSFAVSANYLFGSPVRARPATANCRFVPYSFSHKDYKEYTFAKPATSVVKNVKLGTKNLNEKGEYIFDVEIPKNLSAVSAMRAQFYVGVKETGGRTVSAYLSRNIDVAPFYIGLKRKNEGYAQANEKEPFEFVILNGEGEKISPEKLDLKACLYKVEYNWVLRKTQNGYRYDLSTPHKLIDEKDISINDKLFELKTEKGGEYEVLLVDTITGSSSRIKFTCNSEWETSFANASPDKINLEIDKQKYKYGEKAKLIIKSPFTGKGLLTIEGDEIYKAIPFEMDSKKKNMDFLVKEKYGNNFYCSVTIIRNVDSEFSAKRAYGIIPININHENKKLQIETDMADEFEPNEKIEIKVTVANSANEPINSELTVALVDEGICRLTNYSTPKPIDYFYAKRASQFDTYDIYSMLMPEYDTIKVGEDSTPGGGSFARRNLNKKRLNPIIANRVKSAIVWKTNIKTDSNGNANVAIKLPDFIGELRLMVIATSDKSFGSFDKAIKVKKPIIIRATYPRFLAPNDNFIVPVEIFNQTGNDDEFTVKMFNEVTKKVNIKNGKSSVVYYDLKAPATTGVLNLKIEVTNDKETSISDVEIPVRPAVQFTSKTGYGQISCDARNPEQIKKIDFPQDWIKGTTEMNINFSGMPTLKLGKALQYLLKYPYGCVEQTTSRTFPLLYFADLAKNINPNMSSKEEIEDFVYAGIDRLISMQLYNGGFSMWQNGDKAYPWGSVYAINFFVEAEKNGYKIPKEIMKDCFKYLNSLLIDDNSGLAIKSYSAFVLALGGKPNRSWTVKLWEEKDNLSAYSRMQLALAFMIMKEEKLADSMMQVAIPNYDKNRYDSKSTLNSYTRECAILLSTYLDMNKNSSQIPNLVKILEKSLANKSYYTTQNNAFALMSLGKYAKTINKMDSKYNANIIIDGKPVSSLTHKDNIRLDKNILDKKLEVKMNGRGNLYYSWTVQGIPTIEKSENIDNGISIRRRYLSESGKEIDLNNIKHGELIVVEITAETNISLENVVISDLLPAGLEIENSKLATRAKIDTKVNKQIQPDYVERRDDRLLIFTDLRAGKNRYKYAVRAITKGSFKLPAISAECMYAPEIKSINGFSEIKVK